MIISQSAITLAMQQFDFSVVSEGEDRRVPIAVAGQIMVDVQKLITDIGRSMIRSEMWLQNEIPHELLDKFTLRIGGPSDGGVGSDAGKGSESIMEDALGILRNTLDFLGTGAIGTWMEDNFKDPFERSAVASDLIALAEHISGYVLKYGAPDSQSEFRNLDRKKLSKHVISGSCSWVAIGNVSSDPKFKGHWTFRNSRNDIPMTLSKDAAKGAEKASKMGIIWVRGSVSRNYAGKMLALGAVESFEPILAIPFRRIITPHKDIPLVNAVEALPSYVPSTKMWKLSYPPLGIEIAKQSWDDCICAFHDYFAFLWEQYAESNKEFEGEEKETRDILLSFLPIELSRRHKPARQPFL